MFFASFHFFIFFILRITINCNYLFTKHFKYKTLIYLCQRPPEKFVVFYLYKGWRGRGNGYSLLQMFFWMRWYLQEWGIRYRRCFFWCGGICKSGIFAVADAFFDAVVSARVRYSLLRMLFSCQSCIIASATCLFYNLKMLPTQKLHLQFTYSKACRCFCSKNNILNLLIPRLVDASPRFLLNCVLWNIKLLTLHNLNFVIWYHYIFREFLFSEFSKPQGSHLGFRFLKHNLIWKEMLLTSW